MRYVEVMLAEGQRMADVTERPDAVWSVPQGYLRFNEPLPQDFVPRAHHNACVEDVGHDWQWYARWPLRDGSVLKYSGSFAGEAIRLVLEYRA